MGKHLRCVFIDVQFSRLARPLVKIGNAAFGDIMPLIGIVTVLRFDAEHIGLSRLSRGFIVHGVSAGDLGFIIDIFIKLHRFRPVRPHFQGQFVTVFAGEGDHHRKAIPLFEGNGRLQIDTVISRIDKALRLLGQFFAIRGIFRVIFQTIDGNFGFGVLINHKR